MADEVTEKIIGAAIEVHRILGPGLLESVYESALCHEMELRNMRYQRQFDVSIRYKEAIIHGQSIDLLVNSEVVVEVKSVRVLSDVFVAQTLSYLKATGLKRALLINFGAQKLIDGVKRFSL